jgi:glycosyltransferase involved in cell wall biosynthesis
MYRSHSASVHSGLRIAHLIDSDGPGGAERVVAELARAFQAAGAYNVAFVLADGEGWLTRELDAAGVAIEYFRDDRKIPPACVAQLAASFRRHRVTVAHSHEFGMAIYGAWAAWRAGVRHVITMHGSRYYAECLRRRLLMRAAMAVSGRTVAVSTSLTDAMSSDLYLRRSRIETIPNGVRPQPPDAPTLRGELGLGPDARLLVAVGNLYRVKGHAHLVDAMALLVRQHPALHLAIAGRGDQAEPLAARARALGLAGRVHLLGLRADIANLLAAADVFVLPSLSEGTPLALLEAMFAGRPIVASDVGEVGAVLEGGHAGVLVPPGNAGALAAAVHGVLSDPGRACDLGLRAGRRAAAEYDISRMVRRYAAVYQGLLGVRRSLAAAPAVAGNP